LTKLGMNVMACDTTQTLCCLIFYNYW